MAAYGEKLMAIDSRATTLVGVRRRRGGRSAAQARSSKRCATPTAPRRPGREQVGSAEHSGCSRACSSCLQSPRPRSARRARRACSSSPRSCWDVWRTGARSCWCSSICTGRITHSRPVGVSATPVPRRARPRPPNHTPTCSRSRAPNCLSTWRRSWARRRSTLSWTRGSRARGNAFFAEELVNIESKGAGVSCRRCCVTSCSCASRAAARPPAGCCDLVAAGGARVTERLLASSSRSASGYAGTSSGDLRLTSGVSGHGSPSG